MWNVTQRRHNPLGERAWSNGASISSPCRMHFKQMHQSRKLEEPIIAMGPDIGDVHAANSNISHCDKLTQHMKDWL